MYPSTSMAMRPPPRPPAPARQPLRVSRRSRRAYSSRAARRQSPEPRPPTAEQTRACPQTSARGREPCRPGPGWPPTPEPTRDRPRQWRDDTARATTTPPRRPDRPVCKRAPRRAAADRPCSQEAHASATATTQPEPARPPATPKSAMRFTTTTHPPWRATTTPPSPPRPACQVTPTHPPHHPTWKRPRPPGRCRYPPRHQDARPRRPRRRSRRNRPCTQHRGHPHPDDRWRADEPPAHCCGACWSEHRC